MNARILVFAALVAATMAQGCALLPKSGTRSEQRAEVRAMATETLQKLFAARPSARSAIGSAAGYGVFSNFGMKILVAGGGSGEGVVFIRGSNRETFMKMVELQAGLGVGIKKFRQVWVFERQSDVFRFVNSGWELGGQSTVAAKAGRVGGSFEGALSVTPGVWLYQLTDSGLALELTAKGTKYFKDDKLN